MIIKRWIKEERKKEVVIIFEVVSKGKERGRKVCKTWKKKNDKNEMKKSNLESTWIELDYFLMFHILTIFSTPFHSFNWPLIKSFSFFLLCLVSFYYNSNSLHFLIISFQHSPCPLSLPPSISFTLRSAIVSLICLLLMCNFTRIYLIRHDWSEKKKKDRRIEDWRPLRSERTNFLEREGAKAVMMEITIRSNSWQ